MAQFRPAFILGDAQFIDAWSIADFGISGDLAATEVGADTAAFAGGVLISGSIAATEVGSDVAAFAGTVAYPPNLGVIAASEVGGDIASFAGATLVTGHIAATDSADTAAITGGVLVSGALAGQETGKDTIDLVFWYPIFGDLAVTETGSDTAWMQMHVSSTVLGRVKVPNTISGTPKLNLARA